MRTGRGEERSRKKKGGVVHFQNKCTFLSSGYYEWYWGVYEQIPHCSIFSLQAINMWNTCTLNDQALHRHANGGMVTVYEALHCPISSLSRYRLKHVLHSGCLCVTFRPAFSPREIHMLWMRRRWVIAYAKSVTQTKLYGIFVQCTHTHMYAQRIIKQTFSQTVHSMGVTQAKNNKHGTFTTAHLWLVIFCKVLGNYICLTDHKGEEWELK